MNKMKIGTGDWMVVCDGRKALILENLGDRMFPNLHTKEVREPPDLPTQTQGSAAPGRVYQSTGAARSAVEQTDWHDESERSFLKALAWRPRSIAPPDRRSRSGSIRRSHQAKPLR